jgi:hypothetical protein
MLKGFQSRRVSCCLDDGQNRTTITMKNKPNYIYK